MPSHMPSYLTTSMCGVILILSVTGCGSASPASAQQQPLDQLHASVAPFHDLSVAKGAGYSTVVSDPTNGKTCLDDPQMGGMGIHYLNTALVDDTVIANKPEIMIYEPQKDGSLKFVGVEYIIPFTIRAETATPPVLFGQQFKKNDTFHLWALHAWVGRDNPSGTFTDYNPDVSCQFSAS